MNKIILIFVVFLTGCAEYSYSAKPIFSDAEKNSRSEAFDKWFRKSSVQ